MAELGSGAEVSVRVLEVDADRHRIGLSLRGTSGTMAQAFQDQWGDLGRLPVEPREG
jgi:ribosomal protein S1